MIENIASSILHKLSLKVGRNGQFQGFENDALKLFVFLIYPALVFVAVRIASRNKMK